ncbi:M1 family metallopeptidase [Priestia sp. Y58]|uniref:M1 family metallopeptidase n=1 Tax=Priestia sp. Y58 TaxID=2922804 RepID=UPI0024072031|nr:M1 family metallopeptidase [Priestia sp. Y58]MDG0029972.1 M1 family metallopeptidase [Priestia sp. Y58]
MLLNNWIFMRRGREINRKKVILFIFAIALLICVSWGITNNVKSTDYTVAQKEMKRKYSPQGVPPGSDSKYDMKLNMDNTGKFHLDSTVTIKNISKDSWGELVFYFIPNMFTNKESSHLDNPSAIKFYSITVDGVAANFKLEKDNLRITLDKKLNPQKTLKVNFSYDFTLPEKGLRFTENNGNYYLAQFYPMVATYRDHKWNKEEYRFKGETYHTAFSDFKVTYDIPNEYTFISTSEDDKYPSDSKGAFEVKNVKEIFIALLKKPLVVEREQDNVNIRIFGLDKDNPLYKEISEEAASALKYFQENIGPYPFKQLDIILDELGMEYPGIVTGNSIYTASVNDESLKRIVVHEIAHQWFYGVISNDPYNDAWLDEGFADFATLLYFTSKSKEDIPYKLMDREIKKLKPLPVNLPLDEYGESSSSYIYGKSNAMLWKLFEKRGGKKEAEKFLKSYYALYSYKEVDTQEFIRFTKHYFDLDNNAVFKEWLILKK